MSQLVQTLSEFRAGKLSRAQLLAQVTSLLGEDNENIDRLLEAVQDEHAIAPLPLGAFVALRKHLHALAAPKTVAITPPRTEVFSAPPTPASVAAAPGSAAPPTEEVLAKQAIGALIAERFRLVDFVGSGGTSRLYKAVDQRKVEAGADDPHVAVKILTLPYKDTLEALAVLHRETEGLRALAHPNIVRVFDCDRDGDTVFMTMEFIRGKTLHALMRSSHFLGAGRAEVLPIIRGIASAIEFAHTKSIVHGDLTPGNVMMESNVGASGMAKVIDFGIWRIFGEPAVGQSGLRSNSRGEITGFSPSYASPEMIELSEPDPRDDIYSLACISWELLTGAHPFGRRNAKVARDESIKLEYTDKLTRTQYSALAHALNFNRQQRTSTVQQFIAELMASPTKRVVPSATAAAVLLAVSIGVYFYFSRAPRPVPLAAEQAVAAIKKAEPQLVPAPTIAAPPEAGAVFRDCPTCPLMTAVPAGEFLQGSPANSADAQAFEMPQHRVAITRAFAASRTEITVGEFAEFVQASGRELQGCTTYDGAWKLRADVYWKNAIERQTASHPVSCVSWRDVTEYARWLSKLTGQNYRLPTTSEWEYAARAGSITDRSWATDTEACAAGNLADRSASQRYPGWTVYNCSDAYAQAAPVGAFSANAFGLHDMLGNVFEWVADCWAENYDGAPNDGSASDSGDCSQHEARGGSWFTAPSFVRFAYRNRFASDYRSTSVGFRIVREIAR